MIRQRVALVFFVLSALFPILMLGYQCAIAHAWVPDRPHETIHFLNYHITDAMGWFRALAALDVLWGALFVTAVYFAPVMRSVLRTRLVTVVLAAQALGLCAMIASPFPMDSDQFAYAYYGDLTLHHLNPYPQYTHPLPLDHEEARMAVHWDNPPYVDRYGPAWTLGNAAILAPVVHMSAETQARVLRIAAALAALVCTLILAIILPDVAWRDRALFAFALNPLVIVACGNGGHNDIYLVLFGLLAWFLASRRHFEFAAAALATAVCIKFAYAPLLPALLAYTFASSRSWLRVFTAGAAFIVPVTLYSLPLGIRQSLVDPVAGWNAAHPPHIAYYLWRAMIRVPHLHMLSEKPIAMLLPACMALLALAIAWLAFRRRRSPRLEMAVAIVVLLLPYKVENWYGVMLAPLLLVQAPFALVLFIALTLACEFLQVRIFFATSQPYIYFTSIAILVAIILEEVFVTDGTSRVQSARKESSVLT